MHADLYRVASYFSRIDIRLTPACLGNLSRGVLTVWGVRVASRFFDEEGCVSQIKFNVQELPNLICPRLQTHGSTTADFSRPNLPNPK